MEKINLYKINKKSLKIFKENYNNVYYNSLLSEIEYNIKEYHYYHFLNKLLDLKSTILNDTESIKILNNIYLYYNKRIRNIDDFKKFNSRNRFKQLRQLIDYLYVKYPVPEFLYNEWFNTSGIQYLNNFKIFFLLTSGKNMRTFDNLPFPLTKKEAHLFLQAPIEFDFNKAIYYGKLIQHTNLNNIKEFIKTKIFESEHYKNIDFWVDVVKYLSSFSMLDKNMFGIIIDYINEIKYTKRIIIKNGLRTLTRPEKPNFSIKNRNINKLIEDVENWHKKLKKIHKINNSWEAFKISDFEYITGKEKNKKIYRINQLLTTKQLFNEGNILNHCVVSYAGSCKRGNTSIFSMTVEDYIGNIKNILTIEVNNYNNVVQVRGKNNRSANNYEKGIIKRWTLKNKIRY